jgi:chemotaxis protein CheD
MLPLWDGNGLASPKFGNIAIHRLLELMLSSGCSKRNIVAKVFGGGNLIESGSAQFMIGERNIMVARTLLKEMQIDVISSSVGGNLGRKIQFNTSTGEVKQMLIQKH